MNYYLYFLFYFILLYIILFMVNNNKISNPIKAICVLQSNSNKNLKGSIHLIEIDKNHTKIFGIIEGLNPGKHGFHIHESGDLSDGCNSLCAHYNPFNKKHGGLNDKERHVGDLGNIIANSKGISTIDITDKLIKLRGKYSVIGRSFIIHEDEDDLGKGNHDDSLTTGHSGKRILCGVIGYSKLCK